MALRVLATDNHGGTTHRETRMRAPLLRRCSVIITSALISATLSMISAPTLAVATSTAVVDPAVTSADGDVRVIVQAHPGGLLEAEQAVAAAGGTLTRDLPIVNGFAATLPPGAAGVVGGSAAVRAITLDAAMTLQDGGSTNSNANRSVYQDVVNADDVWATGNRGAGVTVALIDTGISPVPDLAGRILPVTDDLTGKTSPCVNFTGEPDCTDSYGHGTFLAGLIAGSGASSDGAYAGVAPDANLVALKLAGRDGSSDVSSVLAAIQWVVSFKDRYGIRVVNLSLGTDSTQSYRIDPLNYAVERAWDAGIVVVVAASNRGPEAGTISKPGDDPLVITVGSTDDRGTHHTNDDTVPDFSSRGPTASDGLAKPDVAAPGGSLISLRSPGSAVDTMVPRYVDANHRRGSGTSMSTAVVSGAVALMVAADPAITPDRAKYALLHTARNVASSDSLAVGHGLVDVRAAIGSAPAGVANVGVERSSGLGSLDLSRGGVRVMADDPMLTLVNGLLTLQLIVFDPVLYTSTEWTGSKWYGSKWYGSKWYGSKWYGSKWYGVSEDEGQQTSYGTPLPGGAFLGAWG